MLVAICVFLFAVVSAKPVDMATGTKMIDITPILENANMSKEDKMKKIQELAKNAPADVQKEVMHTAENSMEYEDWLADRLKTASPEVQAAMKKLRQINKYFIFNLDDREMMKKVEDVNDGLTQDQENELNEILVESEVQAISTKLGQLSSVEFLSLPDDQKAKKVEEITGTLNAAQKAELEQIGKESETKLHALGRKK